MENKEAAFAPDRREFVKLAVGGALSAAGVFASSRTASATVHPSAPGIKLCAQGAANPTDDDLLFLRQMGAEYVSVASTPDLRTAEGFLQIKKRYADAGITVWNIGNSSVHNMPEVTLNLPGRDQKIEEYKQYLRNLGQAGIYYTTYAHMGNGIWSSGRATIRGLCAGNWIWRAPTRLVYGRTRRIKEPLSHGRVFSKEEIWENYTYFIKQVVPVAEEAGVRSEFTRMILRRRCWREFPAASSPILRAINGRSKLPTAPTSAFVFAAEHGSRVARN